jgi:Domain of unknown function (DUF4397)
MIPGPSKASFRMRITPRRLLRLLGSALVVWPLVALVGAPASAAPAAGATGWIRLAHFSPDTPPVDVYLYPFGGTTAETVLDHVAYGTASPYEPVKPGIYTVAMRGAGASAASAPVISANVTVAAGANYTVAGLGPHSGLTLSVLTDELAAPAGKVGLRLIEASLRTPAVTVSMGQNALTTPLRFPAATGYQPVAAGNVTLTVAAPSGSTTDRLDLTAASSHTVVLLDSPSGAIQVLDLTDAAGVAVVPSGGVHVGLGGAAADNGFRVSPAADFLSGALILVGIVTMLFSVRRFRDGRA